MGWLNQAACRNSVPVSAFYEVVPTAEAVAACASCPVRAPCLADELDRRPPIEDIQGYRAGLPADERRSILTANANAAAAEAGRRRVERVRAAVEAGARIADVADAEGVSRRTIARWLHDRSTSTSQLAG